jgi:hypothetical protein
VLLQRIDPRWPERVQAHPDLLIGAVEAVVANN